MKRTRLIAVGACAVDNILTVPHYPEEDSKLRATAYNKRRGGNTPNTLEVLQQLIHHDANDRRTSPAEPGQVNRSGTVELFLIVTLPARTSTQVQFIASSFDRANLLGDTYKREHASAVGELSTSPTIDLSYSVFREDFTEPVSAYIISSESTSSRTIVTHNALPEMSFDEFEQLSDDIHGTSPSTPHRDSVARNWFHFEGRNPDTTLACMQHLRRQKAKGSLIPEAHGEVELKISVELEKPGREGLQDLAFEADIVFYSKAWAQGEGYTSGEHCLVEQAGLFAMQARENTSANRKILICTWGDQGAYALCLPEDRSRSTSSRSAADGCIHSPAYISHNRPIVDSSGAGDTFVAGILFGMICRSDDDQLDSKCWSLQQTLNFANALAGRKILQEGFVGLGPLSQELKVEADEKAA